MITIEEIALILLVIIIILLGTIGLIDTSRIKWKKSAKSWEDAYKNEYEYTKSICQELQELRKKNR